MQSVAEYPISRRAEWRWLVLVAFLAFAARAAYYFVLVPYNPVAVDRDLYLQIARNVVAGYGFSMGVLPGDIVVSTIRGPVPVYFLVALLLLFGDHALSLAFANWILDASTCVLVYLVALELLENRQVAFTAALLFAFYIPEIFYAWQALSEPLFTLLLAAFVLVFLHTLRSPSLGGFALAGVMLALATSTRPIMQYYLPIALVALIWMLRARGKELVKWGMALSLAFVMAMAPWTVRNYLIFGQFIPVSSYFGSNLYATHYILGEPDYLRPRDFLDEAMVSLDESLEQRYGPAYENLTQPEVDRVAKQEALKIIRQYPGRYLILSLVRFFRLWYYVYGAAIHHTSPLIVIYLTLLVHSSLWGLSIIAFIYHRAAWLHRSIPLFLLLFYYAVGHAAIHVQVRYVIPVVPYVMIWASVTIVQVLTRFKPAWTIRLLAH